MKKPTARLSKKSIALPELSLYFQQKDISRIDLAERIGYSRGYVSYLFTGKRKMTPMIIKKIIIELKKSLARDMVRLKEVLEVSEWNCPSAQRLYVSALSSSVEHCLDILKDSPPSMNDCDPSPEISTDNA